MVKVMVVVNAHNEMINRAARSGISETSGPEWS
jgi:hypothetical protein